MKKALIIASCGVVLALIVGATSNSKANAKPDRELMFEKKCSEPVNQQEHAPCALGPQADAHADMFLRELKRKLRRAYA